jgi:hypothetical protein
MLDVTLKSTEANEVLALVQSVGLNPVEFGWLVDDSDEYIDGEPVGFRTSTLSHRPTDYFCKFGGLSVEFSPGPNWRVETKHHANNWAAKLAAVQLWLAELRKEVDAPDLWATIGQEKALSTAVSSTRLDNRPFDAAEQSLIAAKLDEIKAYLLEGQVFGTDDAATVEREFAYLKESSGRLGRKDWLNILLGGLISIAIGLALDPERARGLLRLAGAVFQSLWELGSGLLK